MVDMDKIVSLSKRRGFIFQSSEIYGGLGSAWDYGPLGVELKNNVKRLWWRDNVHLRDDMVGLDAAITMHPKVWEASGHLASFSDPFTGCPECGRHYREDHLLPAVTESKWFTSLHAAVVDAHDLVKDLRKWVHKDGGKLARNLKLVKDTDGTLLAAHNQYPELVDHMEEEIPRLDSRKLLRLATNNASGRACPNCGSAQLSEPRPAGLMLETSLGPVQETAIKIYLRPETAQGIFVNFDNVLQASRKKLPFGIAQIGKAFRNEITPGNFTFRTREFEQMEIEYFVNPLDTIDGRPADEAWHERWVEERFRWYRRYGIRQENIRKRPHERDELAHYAKSCVDIEYLFPMGWSELEGIANRTDYDLKQHSQYSGKTLEYFDEESKQKIIPYVIEPSAGADRSTLAFLVDAYHEEEVRGEKRVVLRFRNELAPLKIAVLPLLKKNDRIVETAKKLTAGLRKRWYTVYDDTASIGRLYRRQDEVGTPFCVTVDVQTVGDDKAPADEKVTIRDRDTMEQVRVSIDLLEPVMEKLMAGKWHEVAQEHGIKRE
jgi:glycyl-tRNA synthetase